MKLTYIFLISILGLSACMRHTQADDTQKEYFLALLEIGYKSKGKIHYRDKKVIKTCVYDSKPNQESKRVIESFYNLISKEFKVFSFPIYRKKLNDCPIDIDIYIQLSKGKIKREALNRSASNVFSRHDLILKNRLQPSSLGLAYVMSNKSGASVISYVFINQMIKETKYDIAYLQPVIIEELYQAVSLGRDIQVKKRPMSELHENWSQLNYTFPFEMAKYKYHNSVALCGFDLWYLILIYGGNYSSLEDDYSLKFLKNYSAIKKRALEIENNPAYKGLFDPRCSGKNTGINTKIGIQ